MKKTLRKRFIIFAMTAVTVLLVFLVGAINGLNWILLDGQSDAVLEMLVRSDGAFQKMDFGRPPPFTPPMNMDTMRSARFFMVKSSPGGEVLDVNVEQISSVNEETAEKYARTVHRDGTERGRINGYKFAVKKLGTDILTFFMDTSGQRNSFFTVLFASCAIAVVCWLIVLVFVVVLSGRVVRPILAGMEKQKQFITNAGHELKTPLAIIQSNNDAMALIHGENKYNGHIRTQTKRLNVLMSNLLTLAKLDEEIPLPTEAVNVSDVTMELLPAYEDAAGMRKLRFSATVEPGIVTQMNRDSFRQVVTVLLDNALKYTSENGTIQLSLTRQTGHLRLTCENTCDISREPEPERLFERFYRGDAARTQGTDSSGYGIGLSAARAICESFGGRLTADYPSGDTIRFTARL